MAKRRADWVAGRRAAKSVVAAALAAALPGDWPPSAIEIRAEPGGRPFAALAGEPRPRARARFAPGERLPISVSISHAGAYAACAAAWHEPGGMRRSVGIDLGVVEPRSPAFVSTFFTEEERRYVRDAPGAERDLRANVIWCAKEAVLKALGLGLTVDTYAASCVPEPGPADAAGWPLVPADAGWHPFLATCDPALLTAGTTVRGIWRALDGGLVATLASLEPPP